MPTIYIMNKLVAQLTDIWGMHIERKILLPSPRIIKQEYFLLDWYTRQLLIEGNIASGLYIPSIHRAVNFISVAAQLMISFYVKAKVQADPIVLRFESNIVSVLEDAVLGGFNLFRSLRRKEKIRSRNNNENKLNFVRFLVSHYQDNLE
jgi:hypothetical protein